MDFLERGAPIGYSESKWLILEQFYKKLECLVLGFGGIPPLYQPCYSNLDSVGPRTCGRRVVVVVPSLHELPSITLENTVIEKGSQLYLECSLNVTSPYTVNDLAWCFNEIKISEEEYHIKDNKTLLLIIEEAKLSHSGNYSCKVMSDESNYAKTHVKVGLKPNATMRCTSTNHIEIYCTWNEFNSNLPSDYNYSWKLRFEDDSFWRECVDTFDSEELEPQCICDDRECYFPENHGSVHHMRVVLTNQLGTTKIIIPFNPDVETIPNPPESVEVVSTSSESIKWSWKKPADWKDDLLHLFYRVQYSSVASSWQQEVLQDYDQTYYELSDGKPYTEYYFRVSCISEYVDSEISGDETEIWSEWSDVITARTDEAAPSGTIEIGIAPDEVVNGEQRAVKLTWKPLKPEEANGIILQYKVRVWILNGTDGTEIQHMSTTHVSSLEGFNMTERTMERYKFIQVDPQITAYTIEDLNKDEYYLVQITAENSAGESPPASLVIPPYMTVTKRIKWWITLVCVVASIIGFILVVMLFRWSYLKMKNKGIFEPVPQVFIPIEIDADNTHSGQYLLSDYQDYQDPQVEKYDILKSQCKEQMTVGFKNGRSDSCSTQITFINDSGSGNQGNRRQHRDICDEDEGLPNARLSSTASDGKEDGDVMRKHCKDKQTPPLAVVLPPKSPDDYSQLTNNDNIHLAKMPSWNNSKIKSQLPSQQGYCKVTEKGVVMPTTMQAPVPRVGIVHTPTRQPKISVNGVHGNKTLTSCQVTAKQAAVQIHNPCNVSKVSANRNQASKSDEDLGYSQVSANRNQATNSDENLGYSQVSANRNQASNSDGDLGHSQVSANRNQASNSDEDLGYSQVSTNRNQASNNDGHITTNDNAAICNQGDNGYCKVTSNGHPVIQDDSSSMWSDSSESTYPPDSIDGEEVMHQSPHSMSGYVEQQPTTQPVNNTGVRQGAAGDQLTSQHIHGYVAHCATGSQPIDRQQTSQPINNGYVAHDGTGNQPIDRQQSSHPINNGYVAHDGTGNQPIDRQQTSHPINNGYVAHDGTGNQPIDRQQSSQPMNNGYIAHDDTGNQQRNGHQTSQPINNGYVAHDGTGNQPMNIQQTSQPTNNGYVAHDGTGNQPINIQQTSQAINNGYVAHDGTGNQPMNTQQPSQPINNGYVAHDGTGNQPMNTQQPSQPINNGYVAHDGTGNQPMSTQQPSQPT
uniref:Uncharacterized protein LOC100368791 n=1 Tax=Saccoglossus kowalevskii TaxID=10224 RepID=A0ABM0GTE0_SACKO|nr:PREDICTED: uncharacterized protein LOC100368791 [Saccoglossus kowalevskii]